MKIVTEKEMIQCVEENCKHRLQYMGGYTRTHNKCHWKCRICGNEFDKEPSELMHKKGFWCKNCANKHTSERQIMSIEEIEKRLFEIDNGNTSIIRESYTKARNKATFHCNTCGTDREVAVVDVIDKNKPTKCPVCIKKSMEKPVIQLLNKKKIKYIYNKWLKGSNYNGSSRPLKPDFLIEEKEGKLAIELDGQQHFLPVHGNSALKSQQARDKHKNKILKERGYILIRVTSSLTKEWGTEKHVTLPEILHLIEIGINSETGEINFDLFRQYDFNRE